MGKITNPNEKMPYERVDKNEQGQEQYGYRTVDGLEEIVHIPSGKSNMTYHIPQSVMNAEGCYHVFLVSDIGRREVACRNQQCGLTTTFHGGNSYREEAGKGYITFNHKEYEVIIS